MQQPGGVDSQEQEELGHQLMPFVKEDFGMFFVTCDKLLILLGVQICLSTIPYHLGMLEPDEGIKSDILFNDRI